MVGCVLVWESVLKIIQKLSWSLVGALSDGRLAVPCGWQGWTHLSWSNSFIHLERNVWILFCVTSTNPTTVPLVGHRARDINWMKNLIVFRRSLSYIAIVTSAAVPMLAFVCWWEWRRRRPCGAYKLCTIAIKGIIIRPNNSCCF